MEIVADTGTGPITDVDVRRLYAWPEAAVSGAATWVRCNMVMSLDGVIAGPDGQSASIATPIDKQVFLALRRDCDVILVGAGTARTEGYRPAAAPIALVTRTLDLHLDMPLFAQATDATPRTLVITTDEAAAAAPAWLLDAADLLPCGASEVDLPRALAELRRRGMARVHCEGGPALMTSLIADHVLDELLLTVTPVLIGAGPRLVHELIGAADAAFTQVLTEDGTLLLRVAFAPAVGS